MNLRRFNYCFFPLAFLLPILGFVLFKSSWRDHLSFCLMAAAVLAPAGALWAWGTNRWLIAWLSRKWPFARAAVFLLFSGYVALYLFLCAGAIYDGKITAWNLIQFWWVALWALVFLAVITLAFLIPCTAIYGYALKRLKKEGV
jgi:hypothetical protein